MITAKMVLLFVLQSSDVSSLGVNTEMIDSDEALCLAQAVYYEARSETTAGQFAVAHVTLNRVKDPRFPKTVCKVVRQAILSNNGVKLQCAYSWYCDNEAGNVPVRNNKGEQNESVMEQFRTASLVAITALASKSEDNTNGATYFFNPKICNPNWARTMVMTKRIGNHDFYRPSVILASNS